MDRVEALREWCIEKALVVEHLNINRTLEIAHLIEAHITGKLVAKEKE